MGLTIITNVSERNVDKEEFFMFYASWIWLSFKKV